MMSARQRKPTAEEASSEAGSINRRQLLSGRFWRLFLRRPARTPLVMRYPKSSADVRGEPNHGDKTVAQLPPGPSIHGISIAPVAATHTRTATSSARRVLPVFRPPGAIEEQQFLAGCTRCTDCIEACPHSAIVHAPLRLTSLAGTPVIEPDVQPCLMCEDFPCIAACKPGVLSHRLPSMMGTAHVTQHLCLAHHGTTCTVCSERCPVEGAIVVTHGKPTVNENACTGCGVCRYVCPAPENAILLMPTFSRPEQSNP